MGTLSHLLLCLSLCLCLYLPLRLSLSVGYPEVLTVGQSVSHYDYLTPTERFRLPPRIFCRGRKGWFMPLTSCKALQNNTHEVR